MSTLTLRLPVSLHRKIKELAKDEGISINQFLASAAAEKMSALLTKSYLEKESMKGSKEAFDNVMDSVPDIEPEDYDRL
jgi:divalent metal cation (Fe/Co/Zn/Cd) transporter